MMLASSRTLSSVTCTQHHLRHYSNAVACPRHLQASTPRFQGQCVHSIHLSQSSRSIYHLGSQSSETQPMACFMVDFKPSHDHRKCVKRRAMETAETMRRDVSSLFDA